MDPSGYGWKLGSSGYEPVPTLDPMAPKELLKFISCNCKGDCTTDDAAAGRMMLSASQHVEIEKALPARIALIMESLEKTQILTSEELEQPLRNT